MNRKKRIFLIISFGVGGLCIGIAIGFGIIRLIPYIFRAFSEIPNPYRIRIHEDQEWSFNPPFLAVFDMVARGNNPNPTIIQCFFSFLSIRS